MANPSAAELPLEAVSKWLSRAMVEAWPLPQELPACASKEDPLVISCTICFGFAAAALFLSWITRSCSQVDKLWSVAPCVYVWVYTFRTPRWDGRLCLMCFLSSLWGARLTFNFARKGGYNGEEDYRWPELRRIIANPVLFQVFNVCFIATYQNVLLLLQVGSVDIAYRVAVSGPQPLGLPDLFTAAVFLLFLLGETVADEQQWHFQNAKLRAREGKAGAPALAGDYKRGFLTQGLFSFSRHPNFLCEQAMWATFYFFSVGASGAWLNWSALGPVLLILLFQGSTRFTEYLTLRRYPEYVDYQRAVPMLAPLPGLIGHVPPKRSE